MFRPFLSGIRALFRAPSRLTTVDRRKLIRLSCHYRVNCILPRKALLGVVTEMSVQGMRIRLSEGLRPGQELKVVYAAPVEEFPADTVRCRVLWCARALLENCWEVGVEYADDPALLARSWIKYILRELGLDAGRLRQRRRFLRAAATLTARVEWEGRTITGRVLNLGMGGALLAIEAEIPVGRKVVVEMGPLDHLDRLILAGVVCSCRFVAQSQSWFHGLEWADPGEEEEELLGEYVVSLLKKAARGE